MHVPRCVLKTEGCVAFCRPVHTVVRVNWTQHLCCAAAAYRYVCLHLVPLMSHEPPHAPCVHMYDAGPLAVVLWISSFPDTLFVFVDEWCDLLGVMCASSFDQVTLALAYAQHARRRTFTCAQSFVAHLETVASGYGDDADVDADVEDDWCSVSSCHMSGDRSSAERVQRALHGRHRLAYAAWVKAYFTACAVAFHARAAVQHTYFGLYLSMCALLCAVINGLYICASA